MSTSTPAAMRLGRGETNAHLAWRIANPLLATLLGFLVANGVGAAIGLALGLAFVSRARIWATIKPTVDASLQRFAGYLPFSVLRLFERRRAK